MATGTKTHSAKRVGLSSRGDGRRRAERAEREETSRSREGRDETSHVCAVQRARILTAAAQVLATHGYTGLSSARITSRARVSRRTFYDLFENREDCFLALFDETVARATQLATTAAAGERSWREQVRAGLGALLVFVGDEPVLGSLLITDTLRAGPNVLARRANVLETLHTIIDQGRAQTKTGRELPPLTAEGIVGAVLAVLHARLLLPDAPLPITLLNPLMSTIMLPYLGPAAAAKELQRSTPSTPPSPPTNGTTSHDTLEGIEMRITYRTLRVLVTIAEQPGASNRQIADQAGVVDQGQISKLLARLERLELIRNAGEGQPHGEPNAWTLTPRGTQVTHTIDPGT
jgi:AcrR family transcriptional regulator